MVVFNVFQPPGPAGDRIATAEKVAFVRDGYSVTAAAFAPFWMVANRTWLALAIYLALFAAIQAAVMLLEIRGPVPGLLMAAIHAVVGFEAAGLRSAALERSGWTPLGTVSGRSEAECERRFFDNWLTDDRSVKA